MLKRTPASLAAKHRFYTTINHVNIFTEDTKPGMKKVFSNIFTKSIGEVIPCTCIFPLGGRSEVIKAYNKFKEHPTEVPSIFIIDGDFDLFARTPIREGNLFQLSKYSIENYLFDRDAIMEICNANCLDLDLIDIESRLNIDKWSKNLATLVSLYINYAISEMHKTGIPTTGKGISHLVSDGSGFLDPKKVATAVQQFKSETIAIIGEEIYKQELRQIQCRLSTIGKRICRDLVSGKSGLFPLLVKRVKSVSGCTAREEQILIQLSQHCCHEDFIDAYEHRSI